MVKRVLDIESDEISVSSSPSKRLHTGTTTPARSSSGSTSYTPSSYTIPSDSPSNPFGFNRASQNFELPQPTKFSKHLCLRFQLLTSPRPTTRLHARSKTFLSKLDESKTYDQQGTYRVVQVPLSYTFRHLHALVLFLFNGNPAPPTTPDPGHLFEVQTGVQMCEYEKQPGIIKSGRPWLRLSSVRDPYYSPQSIMDLIASADTPYDMDEEAWRWEGEDEAAMSSVWQDQTDSTRGIIYYHDAAQIVHITVNTQNVPKRKGVGNRPFVFRAFGVVHLDPPSKPARPSPPPLMFPSMGRALTRAPRRRVPESNSDGEHAPRKRRHKPVPEADTEVESQGEEEERPGDGLDTRHWNSFDAFTRFLKRAAAAAQRRSHARSRQASSSPSASSRGLPSASSPALPPSSPAPRSSSPPAVTPAPSHALTRFRVERVSRQMERMSEIGMQIVRNMPAKMREQSPSERALSERASSERASSPEPEEDDEDGEWDQLEEAEV